MVTVQGKGVGEVTPHMDGRLNKNLINFFYVLWVLVSLCGQKTELGSEAKGGRKQG